FIPTVGKVTFPELSTKQTITIPVVGDNIDEADEETFFVNLGIVTNATVTRRQAVGTIIDDDPPPTINISNVSLKEGNDGETSFVFNVSLSSPSSFEVTVDYATADVTAKAGSDYSAVSGMLKFAPETLKQ